MRGVPPPELNMGLERAKNELVVLPDDQDVYLPQGWDKTLVRQYRLAQRTLGPIGVAGVYGVGQAQQGNPIAAERTGWHG